MEVTVLRVFVDKRGDFGNPLAVIVDANNRINPKDRQTITTKMGFSESVFINSLETFDVSIFNPQQEVSFAGHALVGTSNFIRERLGNSIDYMFCKAGKIITWQENDLTWIQASLENTPPWHHKELANPILVENLPESEIPKEHTFVWSWIDKDKGVVRARTFAPDWGIPEDEANGSGSMQLSASLGRELEIHHGKGSVIYAKPIENGLVDVGGRVKAEGLQNNVI